MKNQNSPKLVMDFIEVNLNFMQNTKNGRLIEYNITINTSICENI